MGAWVKMLGGGAPCTGFSTYFIKWRTFTLRDPNVESLGGGWLHASLHITPNVWPQSSRQISGNQTLLTITELEFIWMIITILEITELFVVRYHFTVIDHSLKLQNPLSGIVSNNFYLHLHYIFTSSLLIKAYITVDLFTY